MTEPAAGALESVHLSDEAVVARVRDGETGLFELLMRRHNQRLYRAARAILGDDHEAEDVMQDAYVRAYTHLDQFEGRARFSTWLTRIAVHEAFARLRRRGRHVDIEDHMDTLQSHDPGPEQHAGDRQLGHVVEVAVAALPEPFRAVFVLREIEGMSTAETAACLDIGEDTAKTRLHRARALLRRRLDARIGTTLREAFHFAGARCDRMVATVMDRIAALRAGC